MNGTHRDQPAGDPKPSEPEGGSAAFPVSAAETDVSTSQVSYDTPAPSDVEQPVTDSPALARLRALVRSPAPAVASPPVVSPAVISPAMTEPSVPRGSADGLGFLAPPEGAGELGRLGGYRVTKVLGRGGMGLVLAGEDPRLGRAVALKVMLPELAASPVAKSRFLQEARAAAAVEHENIIPIWRVDEERGVPFLVMPRLAGVALDDALGMGRPLPVPMAVTVARQVAAGLAAAHAAGLVHRDIKPSNVWLELGSDGGVKRVRILAFGLARLDRDGAALTKTGMVVGTPAYMAPEQARGLKVDPRADLFSLGATLYQMLTGQRAFRGSDPLAVLTAIAVDTPTPTQSLNPAVPHSLARLVSRLLAKDPAERPATATEVEAELRAIDDELARAAAPEPAARPRRRWPLAAVAVALLLGGGLLAAFGGTIIRVATNTGELVIESADPDVEVVVRPEGGVAIQSKDRRFVLTAGDGMVEFRDPDSGAVASTEKFRIERGGRTVVTATFAPKPTGPAPVPAVAAVPTPAKPIAAAPVPAPEKPPVKVFVLAGQSNMAGRAKDRTLARLAGDPALAPLLNKVRTADGAWVVRDDVAVYSRWEQGVKKGPLTVGFGFADDEFGPELGFGAAMGDEFENPVLLLKVTQGGMSLAGEGRPPSAGGQTGAYYKDLIATVRAVLADVPGQFPQWAGRGHELAGFVWFQGWNDVIDPAKVAEYESNLGHLVADVRKDLGRPDLPIVIGGFGIPLTKPERADALRKAQNAVAARPAFAGTVAVAPTTDYWDTEAAALLAKGWNRGKWTDPAVEAQFGQFGSQPEYHYLGSGKTFLQIGFGFAATMDKLLGANPTRPAASPPPAPPRPAAREAVDAVLALGGRVVFESNGQDVAVGRTGPVPGKVRDVILTGVKGLTADAVAPLAGLPPVTGTLSLTETNAGDGVLAALAGMPAFRTVEKLLLDGTLLSDAGLAHLSGFPAVTELNLMRVPLGPAGVAHAARVPNLKRLNLGRTRVGAAALRELRAARNLRALDLRETPTVDVEALRAVGELTGLTELVLFRCPVTDDGVAELLPLKNLVQIALSADRLTASAFDTFVQMKSVGHLLLLGYKGDPAALARLSELPNLVGVDLSWSQLGDADLEHLHGCRKLTWVKVIDVPLSDAAVRDFQAAVPGVRIDRKASPARTGR